jgi:hypothetical protein
LFKFFPANDWSCVKQNTDNTVPTICRLDREYREALEGRAKDLNLKVGELVRKYLVASLQEDATKVTLHEELPAIREEIKQLRRDLSLLAEALLTHAGKLEPAKARQWAERNIIAR